jgi:hypothetical protein
LVTAELEELRQSPARLHRCIAHAALSGYPVMQLLHYLCIDQLADDASAPPVEHNALIPYRKRS